MRQTKMTKPKTTLMVLILAYLAFISIGLPDGLLGVAWPSIRTYFNLPIDALGSLLVTSTAGYLISSFYNGWLLARVSTGVLLVLSCILTSISLFGYAVAPQWWVVIVMTFLTGFGAGAIDAGLNTYAAKHFEPRTINWLHAAYGIGVSAGPYLMIGLLTAGISWQSGYTIVGATLLLIALWFAITVKRWSNKQDEPDAVADSNPITIWRTLCLPAAWFSIAVFFINTGIEAATGFWAYSLFTEARGVAMATAGLWVSLYWGIYTIGRFGSGFIANHVDPRNFLRVCTIGVITGAALLWLDLSNLLSFMGLAMMGLFLGPVFPTLIATTPARVGSAHASNSIGFQIAAAALGWSLIPALFGVLAEIMGLNFVAPALFMVAVLLFLTYEGFLILIKQKKVAELLPVETERF